MSEDEDGDDWAIKCADQIVAGRYSNMGVTYSPGSEYGASVDVLPPQTFKVTLGSPDPMATWRPAKSLDVLLDQVNEAYPGRDKSSDGTIGDAAHQATKSEHNPDANGVVRARDITNDPAHGLVSRKLAEALVASRDPRILYVISNAEICSSVVSPWQWRPYSGVNAHRAHMHLSVVESPALYDDTRPWSIGVGAAQPQPSGGFTSSGRGSWYSQFVGKFRWVDAGDAPGSAALGVPDDLQGVSFFNSSTLGKWFLVQAPNGVTSIEQQTDIGPNPNTGRTIDISAAAAERFGYSPANFPTDSIFSWRPIDPPAGLAGLTQQQQAARFRDMRTAPVIIPPTKPKDPMPDNPQPFNAAVEDTLTAFRPILEQRFKAVQSSGTSADAARDAIIIALGGKPPDRPQTVLLPGTVATPPVTPATPAGTLAPGGANFNTGLLGLLSILGLWGTNNMSDISALLSTIGVTGVAGLGLPAWVMKLLPSITVTPKGTTP